MKQTIKYQILSITNKLKVDIRLIIEDRGCEYLVENTGGKNLSISTSPIINISIVHPTETDSSGVKIKTAWNPNDVLVTTKFSLPIFITELVGIQNDMKTPELYTYQGDRLELNEAVASKSKHVFMIGNTTVELSPVVIDTVENRIEGIKIKFNNENSTTFLSINELNSLVYNLTHLDIDNLTLALYTNFATRTQYKANYTPAPTTTTSIPSILQSANFPI